MYVPTIPANYVSRPQEEQEIITLIAQSQKDAQSVVVLDGIDGYGKSTLAKAVCHATDIRKIFAENIYWVELGGKEDTERIGRKELYKQLKNLGFPLDTEITYTDLATELRGKRCLVVLDDLREKDVLIRFLQAGKPSCCTWLITTQKLEAIPFSEVKNNYTCQSPLRVNISGMRRNEAFKLLGYGWSEFARGKLQRLADRLYEFPLLITLVRSNIDEKLEWFGQTTIDEAIDSVNEDLNRSGISKFVEGLNRGKSEELFLGLSKPILQEDKERLQELSIFRSHVSIPLSVLERLWNQDRSHVGFICQRLYKCSMLKQYNSKEGMIVLKDTVQRYFFEKEPKEKIRDIHEKLLRAYEALPEETVLSKEEENYLHNNIRYHLKKAGRSSNSSPVPNFPNFPMHILHLSDLHFGTAENAQEWYTQLAADLRYELNCARLDAVIFSGDIANKSTPEEYDAAKVFLLDKLIPGFQLERNQLVIVPGNHDLNWELAKQAYTLMDRQDYQGELQEGCYIPVKDDVIRVRDENKYKQRFANFSKFYKDIKGEPYPLEYEQQGILHHIGEQNLLILGLNSAWQLDHHYKSRANIHSIALSNALDKIYTHYKTYEKCLKIAVWHHPLDSAFPDRIADRGFMEQLAVAGFRLFLHGHIHKAETSLYRYDLSANGRKLDRICAGTFGAPVGEWVPGYPLQYNLLKFEDNKLTVHTRRRAELNGAWQPDAQWRMGAGQNPLPYYEIQLFAR